MITDLIFIMVITPFFMSGIKKPEMAFAGLLIVEIMRPQTMSYGILASLPMSAISYLALFTSMVINAKKIRPPKPFTPVLLISFFMAWITYTTQHALFPGPANFLWDSAFKNMLIFLLAPFVLNKKHHFELLLLITVSCISFFVMMAGLKTMLGGGGYKANLISAIGGGAAQPLAESSTLAMACVMVIPLIIFLLKESKTIRTHKYAKAILIVSLLTAIPAVIGTTARTGLICLAFLLLLSFTFSNRKLIYLVITPILISIGISIAPADWLERMSTLSEGKEASSGRTAVWRWTLDFVSRNPNGGGFQAYIANKDELHNFVAPGKLLFDMDKGKAFHNTFFQTLGEHGYIGFSLYFGITIITYLYITRIRNPELRKALFSSYTIFNIGSMFIGIAYLIWQYLFLILAWSAFSSHREKNNAATN